MYCFCFCGPRVWNKLSWTVYCTIISTITHRVIKKKKNYILRSVLKSSTQVSCTATCWWARRNSSELVAKQPTSRYSISSIYCTHVDGYNNLRSCRGDWLMQPVCGSPGDPAPISLHASDDAYGGIIILLISCTCTGRLVSRSRCPCASLAPIRRRSHSRWLVLITSRPMRFFANENENRNENYFRRIK